MPPSASQDPARPAARPWLAAARSWIDGAWTDRVAEPRRRRASRSAKRPVLE
jgi:hypothetical protein